MKLAASKLLSAVASKTHNPRLSALATRIQSVCLTSGLNGYIGTPCEKNYIWRVINGPFKGLIDQTLSASLLVAAAFAGRWRIDQMLSVSLRLPPPQLRRQELFFRTYRYLSLMASHKGFRRPLGETEVETQARTKLALERERGRRSSKTMAETQAKSRLTLNRKRG